MGAGFDYEIKMKAQQLIKEADKVDKILGEMEGHFARVTKRTVDFNVETKQMVKTLEGFDTSGKKVRATVKDIGDTVKANITIMDDFNQSYIKTQRNLDKVDRKTREYLKTLKDKSAIKAQEKAQKDLNDSLKTADKETRTRLERQKKASAERKKIADQEVKDANKLINALNKLRDTTLRNISAEKRLEKQQDEQIKTMRIYAQAAEKLISKKFALLAKAPPSTKAEKKAYTDQLSRLKTLIIKHKFTTSQVNTMWGQVARGNIQVYTGRLKLLQDAIHSAQNAHGRLGSALRKIRANVKRTQQAVRQMTLSWRSLVRVVIVQFAHRAVTAFSEAVKLAVRNSIELTKRVAEIKTLSLEASITTDQWTIGLKRLASQFGLPVLDQAEAAYQALSNQVVHGAEAFKFLEEANKFAIITNSSTTESVNLLSSAINAFALDASRAERINASFFKTIELGRVRSTDMADSFGDVAVLAKQLNITLEELQGTIATLTIQGIKYNKAQTQIRGLFIKLIKPTTEMKKLFRDIGVDSGEAAIKTFGWVGFLRKLEKVTKGSSTELAKYISRIRGISGAMALQGKNLDLLGSNIDQISDAYKTYAEVANITISNVGKKFEIELAKITQHFDSLGKTVLDWIVDVSDNYSSLGDTVITVSNIFVRTIKLAIIPAIWTIGVALTRMVVAHPLSGLFLAIGALATAFELLRDKSIETAEAMHIAWKKSNESIRHELDKTRSTMFDLADRTIQKFYSTVGIGLAKQITDITKVTDTLAESLEKIHDRFLTTVKSIGQASKEALNASKTHLKSLETEIKRISSAIANTATKLDKTLGIFSLENIDIEGQIKTIESAISRLNERSSKAIAQGNAKTFKVAEDSIEALLNKLRDLQLRKRNQISKDRERFIKEEQKYQNSRIKQEADYDKEFAKAKLKTIANDAKETIKGLNKSFNLFAKSQAKMVKARIKYQKALTKENYKARQTGIREAKALAKESKRIEKIARTQFKALKKRLKQEQLERNKAAQEQIDTIANIAIQELILEENLRKKLRQSKIQAIEDEIKLAISRGERLNAEALTAQQLGDTELAKQLSIAAEAAFQKEKALRQSLTEFKRQEIIKEAQILKQASLEEINIIEKAEQQKIDVEINTIKERMKLREKLQAAAEAKGVSITGFDKFQKRDLKRIKKLEEEKLKTHKEFNAQRKTEEDALNQQIEKARKSATKSAIDAEEELIKRIIKRAEGQKKILDLLKAEKKEYEAIILLQKQLLTEFDILFKKTKTFDIGAVALQDPEDALIAIKEQIKNLERVKDLNKELETTDKGKVESARRGKAIDEEILKLREIIAQKEKEAQKKESVKDLAEGTKKLSTELKTLETNIQQANIKLRKFQDIKNEIATSITTGPEIFGLFGEELKGIGGAITDINNFMVTLKKDEITKAALALKEALKIDDTGEIHDAALAYANILRELSYTVQLTEEHKGYIKRLDKLAKTSYETDEAELKRIVRESEEAVQSTLQSLRDYKDHTVDSAESTKTFADNTATLAANLKAVAEALRDIGRAAAANKKAGVGDSIQRAHGGLVSFFAEGGKATSKGTDTIPAMLSPGEFVVNAKATKDFYSQLVAINSGSARRFSSGGSVTNQIGDVIVNPQMTGDAKMDIVSFGRELQKATRQGRLPKFN